MTSYSVPLDQVPDDGYPYHADLCPACQQPRPFRIEDDDDGFSSATCAICGLVVPYGSQDSPGASPEPEGADDDAPTSDAMTLTYDADGTPHGSVDDVERLMAEANGPLGSTVNGMRWDTDECAIVDLLWSHGIVMNDDGYAVLIDEQDDELNWCSTCKEWTLLTPLTDDISEEPIDPDFPMGLCEGCGYATPLGYELEPEPYVQTAQCGECKVGTLVTQPPDERVPASVGTIWSCDTCRHVRLVPVMTPELAAKVRLWGPGLELPHQWMIGRPKDPS